MLLTELCQELRNWFEKDIYTGTFSVSDGNIDVDFLQNGQFFRIVGSTFNDGVYQYPTNQLVTEEFDGAVWAMAVPPAVIALAEEIEQFNEKYATVINSPYQSESFGGYSYTKAGSGNGNSGVTDWKNVFYRRLNRWRKI